MADAHRPPLRAGLAITALVASAGSAHAQVWALNAGTLNSRAEAFTQRNGAILCNIVQDSTAPPVPMIPGLLGSDFAQFIAAGCGNMIFTCPLSGYAYGDVRVNGVGSPLLRIEWRSWTNARHYCPESGIFTYRAFGEMRPFNPQLALDAAGVAGGTNVQIDYAWANRSAAFSRSEAGAEDQPSFVLNTSLVAAGVGDLFALAGFNFDVVASGFRVGNGAGQFNQVAGAPWGLGLTGDVRSEINFPGRGFPHKDSAGSFQVGELWLTLDPQNFPIPPGIGFVPNPTLEFSLDIGSDTELSPPAPDGDEVFDPGDVYPWFGPFYAGPTNGTLDDAVIFVGIDINPDPLIPLGPPNSAPTCTAAGVGAVLTQYFDLDDTDRTDFALNGLVDPTLPLPAPVGAFNSACVWEANNLIWSYDDDEAAHYVGLPGPFGACAVPTTSLSPSQFDTWGQSFNDDEVLSGLVTPGIVPTTLGAAWGVVTEAALHPNLAPNPDVGQADDDDVDGLDVVGDVLADGTQIDCPFWYFSADHEAVSPAPLDPGDIYMVTPGGPVMVVDDVLHLGLLDTTDVDAFEFAFAPNPVGAAPGLVLVVVFSVDDDDPLTPGDESGGLDPAMVYVSSFQGFSVPFLTAPLAEDVDALSVYADALPPVQIIPNEACCFCNGLCQDMDPNNCLNALGFPQGAGTFCAAGVCEPYGACCFGAICVDNVTPTFCLNNGGQYQGDCVSCALIQCTPTGACCFSCANGAPVPLCPNPTGPTIACQIVTQAQCIAAGGVYRGDNTGCGCCNCPGDINGDGLVNVADFNILAVNFGGGIPNCKTHAQGDLNCDGVVNVADFNILAVTFGCGPIPGACP